MAVQLWTTTPTINDDFIIGGAGASNIDGNSGDDLILGDSITPFATGTNQSLASPLNIDSSARWTTDENPFFGDASIPHTSLFVAGTAGSNQYCSVTVGAGETLTIDIDFGQSCPIGGNVDTMVRLRDSGGVEITTSDDASTQLGGGGSFFVHDSYLTFTNNTGSPQTYIIEFGKFSGVAPFDAGQTFVANISVTGHAATGTVSMGNDILTGGAGDDTIAGMGGDDTLLGGSGQDQLYGGSGNDSIDGGIDQDTAHYEDATGDVTVDLNLDGLQQDTGGAGLDTLTSIENVTGGGHNDTLTGTDTFNVMRGGGGNDTIYGNGGSDSLSGEDGDDQIFGGDGDDSLVADDSSTGNWGNNMLDGGIGNDTLTSGGGNDGLFGRDGNDRIFDRGGNDIINGGNGVDELNYSGGPAVTVDLSNHAAQNTGAGTDTITNIENLTGSFGNDTLTGSGGNNRLDGNSGNDVVNGGGGNDTLVGGDGDDTYDGGTGKDTLTYSELFSFDSIGVTVDLATPSAQNTVRAGMDTITNVENLIGSNYNDTLSGNAANNTINGGVGNDIINGRGGNDSLSGGDGNDVLIGSGGDDNIMGNAGIDTASYVGASAAVTVNLGVVAAQNTGGAGIDTIAGIENLTGSNFNDTLIAAGGANVLNGGLGNDMLTGGNGADIFVFDTTLNKLTNVDKITDFVHLQDVIQLDHTIFGAAGPDGTLDANAFVAGNAAGDADDRIIYNSATGNIFYDADGNGAGAAVLFAHVTAGTVLSNADFQIVG